ncbi:histidinol-phosphatase [Mycobacterium ulcerans str. Harvey]|uniref:Histidinol-phosphatase n=1 Tax=Mycobacterium ulcerans str. Harvey TaxID=1299332 RepID=A0ABP3AIN7_MYCUL|nr:histidinol-phosphatase [Mycobacterium ulcerans str. Harvey]
MAELNSASLSFSSLSGWAQLGLRGQFVDLTDAVWRVRAYGDFFSYCLLAEGAIDIAAEPEVSVWDLAPLDILVREAGGQFSSLDGTPARTAAAPW